MTRTIRITLGAATVRALDRMVKESSSSRSSLIEDAIAKKTRRSNHARLARECAKLDPLVEVALAEEGLSADVASWPEY